MLIWTVPLLCGLLGTTAAQNYPAPPATGAGWEAAFAKAKTFVSKLSIDQKANLLTGTSGPCVGNIAPIKELGFRGLCLQDGPLGVRLAQNVSVFPAGVVAAASWDRSLTRQRGVEIGAEHKGKGTHVALGPVVGPLGKNALDGRIWEGFSVDPYLTGAMAEETVIGMQSTGVQSCTKHFIGNEQETDRGSVPLTPVVSSNIDDVTLHELYMWPFANAVRAGTTSIMCAYNKLNGTYACEDSKSMNNLLKTELGFQGYIVSDWGAQHSGAPAANAGLDLAMPGGIVTFLPDPSYWRGNLASDVRNGKVNQSRLDDMAVRFMTPYFLLGQDSVNYPYVDPTSTGMSLFPPNPEVQNSLVGGPSARDVQQDHAQLIRNLGAAATVLLKNDGQILPLKKPKSIGVFANDAGAKLFSIQQTLNYYYGTLPTGGGSGTGHFSYVVDPLSAIKARAAQDGTKVSSFLDNIILASGTVGPGTFLGLNVSAPPDVCLVFLKTWQEEATDRSNYTTDWEGDQVVQKVSASCPNVVVVTHSGGPNTMPWASNPNVKAILTAHYPGQEIGNSIVDVLYGNVNPSGHLPYTIAKNGNDYPSKPVTASPYIDYFPEKLLVDYRHFDAANIEPQYPFGHGLSYTNFSLSSVAVSSTTKIAATPSSAPVTPGGNPALWSTVQTVTCTVTNTGSVAGAAVPQLYLDLGSGAPAGHPLRQLRGFDKVQLNPGQSQTVTFPLMRRDVSYWDAVAQTWTVPAGEMTASVGFSSRDFRGQVKFTLV